MSEEDGFDIVCAECGKEETMPFEPQDAGKKDMYCRSCYEEALQKKQERERSSPRKKHGTRVSLRIECSECGKESELDYVPKGVSLNEMLCEECFEEESEGTRWAEIKEQKRKESKDEWEIVCAECGRTEVLNFEPEATRDYYCMRCFYDHEEPNAERVANKESSGQEGVYIRRKDGDDE